ncbi:MAG TPA: D-alanyl-D-alanine endopeptidase [Methylibium sp.]|uniref:D-alanyl-D-alanine endopeptidase n=1 Tax=Methylibium sp. TaxID=2067992 RepID=UPI002DBE5CF0|nr:D-alanyl-D-alanine endopeptidase [Methylibium sp.]HEU4460314.1 D-alanyl-D-alanine endopeptidase [Methylibium sp.]
MAQVQGVQAWVWGLAIALLAVTFSVSEARAASQGKNEPRRAAKLESAGATKAKARAKPRRSAGKRRVVIVQPSFGEIQGLRATDDPLDLRSSVALVVDQDTNEVLLEKNAEVVLPIASLTKLMTSLVVVEATQPLDEVLTISQDDVDTEKGSRSRLAVGTQLTRGELLHLALMSSENRAAHALGRHYPGGLEAFVRAMNARAALLGMDRTRFVEPTGLSNRNRSTAKDLVTLTAAAYEQPLIRELSTSTEHEVEVRHRTVHFRNTNGLVGNPDWSIGLQKTGYIAEAGRCLLMQAQLAGRKLIMVFLDSAGKYSRIGDARRVRDWIEAAPAPARGTPSVLPIAAPPQALARPLS